MFSQFRSIYLKASWFRYELKIFKGTSKLAHDIEMIKHNVTHALWLINYWQTMITVLYNYQSWPSFFGIKYPTIYQESQAFHPPLLQKIRYIYNHQNDIYVIKHNLDVTHTFTDEQWSVSFMNTHYDPPPLWASIFSQQYAQTLKRRDILVLRVKLC